MPIHSSRAVLIIILPVVLTACQAGCTASSAEQKKLASPARVEHPVSESDIATIRLTSEAEKRLGITTAAIEMRNVARTLDLSGEIVVPQGQTMTVAAPMSGTLGTARGGGLHVGQTVRKGETLLRLIPFLAPERDLRVQIERDIESLTERVAGIRQRKERAEILASEKAGSVRAAEEAQAELAVAEAELKGARERLARFDKGALNSDFSIAVVAPISGVVQKVMAGSSEPIAGGAPLLEISDLSTLWVRVPVYVGDLPRIARGRAAGIRDLSSGPGTALRQVRPVNAPPSADAAASTADLYFSIANGDHSLRPGQRVGVVLPLKVEEESPVIPWSAVLHDVQGNTWVYENSAPQTFVRRAVEVKRISGDAAVLGRAPGLGTRIVITGATELFGTEFGAGK